ncbi:MAG: pantothenate synthetase [Chthonomonadaceae bacterium]|nr:pantothenate synthetase [Chthonomonadaceae bacterium]
MRTFQQLSPLRTYLRGIREEGKMVGFVPTLGALHDGHLSLVRRAKADCDVVVVSVFVNPKQFGAGEDYDAYPRPLARDQQLASEAQADALFAPSVEEMYPAGFQTVVDVPELGSLLEGAHRPGHFAGVATVVTKLLNMVQPNRAYFGQKDYQQLLLIERVARDLNQTADIVMVPTMREPDGLAMSSRNAYLSPEQRHAAPILSQALKLAEERIHAGASDPQTLTTELDRMIAAEPLARPDYIALVDPETLQPVVSLTETPVLIALAVRFGTTRLIDNALVAPPGVTLPRTRGVKT